VADAIFLPVEVGERAGLVAGPAAVDPMPPSALPIELQLANGRCLRFDPGMDTATLMRLIRVVEAA
jgi:transposase